MSHILLLGAGFSRNWGGWLAAEVFEYLLGCPEIQRDVELRRILWRTQATGGFEAALEQIQIDYQNDPGRHGARLEAFQAVVLRMFSDMNSAFFERNNFEFQNDRQRLVTTFLARFDAVFTLNQDVLLEHFYIDRHDIALNDNRRWNGMQMPGMQRLPDNVGVGPRNWAASTWITRPEADYRIDDRSQPLFKLHGSSNWRNADGGPMLVIGGQKPREIRLHPVLTCYAGEFERYLNRPDCRLMVIGYGFRDEHINQVITSAVDTAGLRMFIIAPQGSDLARSLNPTRQPGHIQVGTSLEEVFERSLTGASRRGLHDIFGGDTAEFNKVHRFFS